MSPRARLVAARIFGGLRRNCRSHRGFDVNARTSSNDAVAVTCISASAAGRSSRRPHSGGELARRRGASPAEAVASTADAGRAYLYLTTAGR